MESSIPSDTNYQLRSLDTDDAACRACLNLAREWAKRRRVYVHHCFDPSATRKQIGVFVGSKMISVVTVELTGEHAYLFHVTSPKRSDLRVIRDAVYRIGW